MNNQAAQTMPPLVEEALIYFAKAGDEGDRRYVEAIRQHIVALSQPAGVPEGWMLVHRQTLEIVGEELANARDKVKPAERAWLADLNRVVRGMLAAAPAASGGEGQPMSPPQCRERLMREGKPYPKSGCAVCKTGGMTGCPYEKAVHAPNPPSGASLSSNPNPVTPGLSSEPGVSVSERAREILIGVNRGFLGCKRDNEIITEGNAYDVFVRGDIAILAIERAIEQALTQQHALSSPRQEGDGPSITYDEHERQILEVIDQRDRNEETANELAAAIATLTNTDIGEHSSMNCPWRNAIQAAEEYKPPVSTAASTQRLREYITRLKEAHKHAATYSLTEYEKGWTRRGKVIADELESLLTSPTTGADGDSP
jgi:hypothetical protein